MYVLQKSNIIGGWFDTKEYDTREDALQALGKVLSRGAFCWHVG